MWYRSKEGIEYKINDECIGVKMTREEANKKMKAGMNIIEALEALGLIKFEEATPGPDCRSLVFSSSSPLAYQAIAQLEALGYVVGKSKNVR